MGMVESIRQIGETSTTQIRFDLASIPANATEFARAVRGHWAVENNLHWVLDVCFREDQCRARMGHAAQNLAILRQIALNALKRDTSRPKQGVRPRQKIAGWDNSYLEILVKNLNA